jgi:hypothetical protein
MALVPTPLPDSFSHSSGPSTDLVPLSDAATAFADAGASDNTKRAYSADWADWATWCHANYRPALPADPSTLADYIAALASPPRSLKASTINRRCSAIARAHRLAGFPSPLTGVAKSLSGLVPARVTSGFCNR